MEKEKKDAEERANKYSQEKKYAAETLKELISAENLPKRANAIAVQIEALAENLNMFHNTLVGLGYHLVMDCKDDLKKQLTNISKSSKAFVQDLEKVQTFLKI